MASIPPTMSLANNLSYCSRHQSCEISFFCYDEECYQPLCSLCKTEHLETHQKNQTIPFLLSFSKLLSEVQEKLVKAISELGCSEEISPKDIVSAGQKVDIGKTIEKIKSEILILQTNFDHSVSLKSDLQNVLQCLQGSNAPETLSLIYEYALLQDIHQLQQKFNGFNKNVITQDSNTLFPVRNWPLSLNYVSKSKSKEMASVPLKRVNTCPIPHKVQWLVPKAETVLFDDECDFKPEQKCKNLKAEVYNEASIPSIEIEATEGLGAGLYIVDNENECVSETSPKETLTIYSSENESEMDQIEELEEFKEMEKVKIPCSESDVNGVETRTSLEQPYQPTYSSLRSKEFKGFGKMSFLSPPMTYQTIEESILEGETASLKNVEHCDPIFCQDTIGELEDNSFELEDGRVIQRQCSLENY